MYSRIETITPETAREYLKHNMKNRPKKEQRIKNYARDMKNGVWQLSPQGISFYENGDLADGQNRLEAVVLADVPVNIYVTYDVPNDSTIQDRGVPRSASDILRMAGLDSRAATTAGVSIANFLFALCGKTVISDNVLLNFVKENDQELCEAISVTSIGNKYKICKKAPVMAAAFCAIKCGVSLEGLAKFFEIANTGFYEGGLEQTAAIVLKNYIEKEHSDNGYPSKKALFVEATNAIKDFSVMQPRKKYYKNKGPAFFNYVKKSCLDKYLLSYLQTELPKE